MTAYHNILSEEVFHSTKYILLVMALCTLEVGLLAELLNKLALLLGESGGDDDIDNYDDVTTTIAINIGQTLTTQTHNLTRLCTWLDGYANATIDGGHFSITTKDGGSN